MRRDGQLPILVKYWCAQGIVIFPPTTFHKFLFVQEAVLSPGDPPPGKCGCTQECQDKCAVCEKRDLTSKAPSVRFSSMRDSVWSDRGEFLHSLCVCYCI